MNIVEQKFKDDEFKLASGKRSKAGTINFAILRTAKLKTKASIAGVTGHNSRLKETLNADSEKSIENIIDGGTDLHATIIKKIVGAGAKYRSNSVLSQEVFLSASPEYFRPGLEDQSGTYDKERMQAWKKEAVEWLHDQFGDNVVDCKLHLDESTPHIHAVVVPLTKDNRLSARDIFSKFTLKQMQTGYAKKLETLGIKRGLENSKAKHITIQQYYNAVNSAEKIKIPQIEPPGLMVKQSSREEYAQTITEELKREIKPILQRAKFADFAQRKEKEYKHIAMEKIQENNELKKRLRQVVDNARSTHLDLVLEKAGLERDPKDKNQWVGGGHRITVKDRKFFDHNNDLGGGGAIDLVKHLNQCDYKTAVSWLGQNVSVDEAAKSIRAEANTTALNFSKKPISLKMPEPNNEFEKDLKKYLNEKRMLDPRLTDPLINQGRVYASKFRGKINAVFVCRNSNGVTGAELKGISGKFSGMAIGSIRKIGAFTIGDPECKKVIFVESAIDAISYKQIYHSEPSFVVSTAGATTAPPFVRQMKKEGWKITVAYDNDKKGQEFAKKFEKEFPGIKIKHPAAGRKDWNDLIKNPTMVMKHRQKKEKGRGRPSLSL